MTPRDEEELDLFEARKAVAAARFEEVRTNAEIGAAQRTAASILAITEANGFLRKFRALMQGGNAA